MKDHRKKVSPIWKMISLGLIVTLMASASGCETDLYDDQIYPIVETREECYSEEAWQCVGDEAQLCRNGFWNPWYNCAWNGGTCEVNEDASMGGCVDPPQEEIACDLNPDNQWVWDTATVFVDPDTDDTDTGSGIDPDTDDTDTNTSAAWNVVTVTFVDQTCSICIDAPIDPIEFEDDVELGDTDTTTPNMPGGATNGVLGCCSLEDGNAYWGEDAVVLQSCANGCCAFIDYTSTLDTPAPIRHGCCAL